eukprot:CAMPEP_0194265616 /NCGR_PEP_ID=MMETSP0169-20130528/798_1 /TAXON_ID=218684 /ORGANISM="Corethron pennatum, Strain L29A3" /LENGTH=98 /DNA_ID=CAMNT_0039006121 /DNA_START=88 /DNA_END=381 /DNA_ORIENTATION=+
MKLVFTLAIQILLGVSLNGSPFAAAASECENQSTTVNLGMSIMKAPAGVNPCAGTKPADGTGFDDTACFATDGTVPVGPQAGANVSKDYKGLMEYNGT